MPTTSTSRCPTTDLPRLRRVRPGRGRERPGRLLTVLMIAVCLVLAGLLSSCGEEGTTGAAPLGERAENVVPLNPPTVRFHVSADGQVDASPDLEAEAGEAVAVVLENDADVGYQLRLVDPEGDDVFAVEAPPHGRGDGRAAPREDGRHVAKVYPTGHPDAAEEFTVEVFAT